MGQGLLEKPPGSDGYGRLGRGLQLVACISADDGQTQRGYFPADVAEVNIQGFFRDVDILPKGHDQMLSGHNLLRSL